MTPRIVGVISSRADFQRGLRLRRPPDLFELRLDRLAGRLNEIKNAIRRLSAPLIITARDPHEGGANNLSAPRRRALLHEFLSLANYVDVELRAARSLQSVLRAAADKKIRAVISFHDFKTTPPASQLDKIVARADSLGAGIIKIATRTDTPAQLDTLFRFFDRHRRSSPPIVAMGIGKLGRVSRCELARRGCVLNYAHLGSAAVPGQLSVRELRRALE
jgi:3-dehydroquinate dehydratase I